MSYRPITDFWFLARCKYKNGRKRYGGYLGGFPERARRLVGASIQDPVLHVCGGLAHLYPYDGGFGVHDETLDLDPACEPIWLQDAREPFPKITKYRVRPEGCEEGGNFGRWAGIIIDPPYSEVDARQYVPGEEKYPTPNQLVKNAMEALEVGRKVGIIHYIVPACPKNAKFVACVGIVCGFNNRIRVFSVFERTS